MLIFFVGENSTGKTSVLSLIKIISDPQFWFSPGFKLEELDLGNFEDIISQVSKDKKTFTVGYFESEGVSKKKNVMFLISFKNHQDTPIVDTYSYLSQSGLVHLKIGQKSTRYKVNNKEITSEGVKELHCGELIDAALAEHKSTSSSGYKNVPTKETISWKGLPFGFNIQAIDSWINKGKSSKNASFHMPINPVTWIAPIREKPKRTYDQYKLAYSPEGTHTPYILNDFLGDRLKQNPKKSLLKALEQFGIDSELFKTIKVKRYGRHKTAPFEVDVVLNEEPLRISNVGYGVAQVLPIIVECFLRKDKNIFAIQQPEVHLHPKAQASLGKFFHALASLEDKKFFIETHSDFLIDSFRRMQKNKTPIDAQVLFFERTKIGNKVYSIPIDKNGKYGSEQPAGFRKFFINQEMEMLSL